MNILRFLKKCLTDPPAAIISAKLVLRSVYAKLWWTIYPDRPLVHKLSEGGEFNVLLSAKQIISKHRPVVIIEYSIKTWPAFEASPDKLKKFLKDYEYRVFQFDTARSVLKVLDEPEVWSSEYVNLILYPSEKIDKNFGI